MCAIAKVRTLNPGDRVAIATPGYPCYRNILEALGVEVVSVPVDASTNFQPTTELLDAGLADDPRPLKGLIVASPSNPTGTVLKTSAGPFIHIILTPYLSTLTCNVFHRSPPVKTRVHLS